MITQSKKLLFKPKVYLTINFTIVDPSTMQEALQIHH